MTTADRHCEDCARLSTEVEQMRGEFDALRRDMQHRVEVVAKVLSRVDGIPLPLPSFSIC
jgi:hypothetical protein